MNVLTIQSYIERARQKRQRIRTIFLKLRCSNCYFGFSDIVLLCSIVDEIIDLKMPYSSKEIYSAFRHVDKDDYEKTQKRAILKNLLRKSQYKSVFKTNG